MFISTSALSPWPPAVLVFLPRPHSNDQCVFFTFVVAVGPPWRKVGRARITICLTDEDTTAQESAGLCSDYTAGDDPGQGIRTQDSLTNILLTLLPCGLSSKKQTPSPHPSPGGWESFPYSVIFAAIAFLWGKPFGKKKLIKNYCYILSNYLQCWSY